MAEINLDGEPIFVDVANEPQFPILYSQLLGDDDVVAISYKNDGVKTNNSAANNESETSGTVEQAKPEIVSQPTQNDEIEITIAGIKIKNDRLKCPVCKRYTCATEEKMIRHIRKHRGLNPFQCYMCDYSTYNSCVFREHVNVHQGIKPFKCSYCDYKSASKKNTKKHELRHSSNNRLKCPDCDFIAWHTQSFRSHRKNEHQQKEGDKIYSCKICKRTFLNAAQKKNHSNQHRRCKQCAYVTCSKPLYDAHLQQDHGIKITKRDLKKLFTCAHCPWSSNSKPKILLHLIHHPNQTVDENVIDITVLRNCGIMD